MEQQNLAIYLGQLGELITEYIKKSIEEHTVNCDKLYLNTKYEYGYFAVYLFNADTGNTTCKTWPIKDFVQLCTDQAKREKIINMAVKTLINKSYSKKCDKIIYV